MQVQVNVKSAAKRIKAFVEAAGGTTLHSDVLELMAQVSGFSSYRALEASSQPADAAQPYDGNGQAITTASEDIRTLENAESVVFSATAVDWQLHGNPGVSVDTVPLENRTPYDFIVEQDGSQFRVLVKPKNVHLDNFDGRAVLDMLVEINQGLPCVHMTNDPADEMLATVFATSQGLLIREDGGTWARADSLSAPDELTDLVNVLFPQTSTRTVHLAVLDTAKKYQGSEGLSHDSSTVGTLPEEFLDAGKQTVSDSNYPWAQTNLIHPVRRQHVGSYVKVGFEPTAGITPQLEVSVMLFDQDGVVGDEDACYMLIPYTTDTNSLGLKKLADSVAQLTAYFVEAGYSFSAFDAILRSIAASLSPQERAEEFLAQALSSDTREVALELLQTEVRIWTAAGR